MPAQQGRRCSAGVDSRPTGLERKEVGAAGATARAGCLEDLALADFGLKPLI